MLNKLCDDNIWDEFLEYKLSHDLLNKAERQELSDFVNKREYKHIARQIFSETYLFSAPKRSEINKIGTKKKRIVYSFNREENFILKFIAYLLYEYDGKLCNNCYAFRRNIGAKTAFTDIKNKSAGKNLWCFKTDISNYFNSINVDILSSILKSEIDDVKMQKLLLSVLNSDKVLWQDKIISEQKGAMAGTPISPFLANIYLKELDEYFYNANIIYARYSDDIIVFDTEENIKKHIKVIHDFFDKYKLSFNPEKETLSPPDKVWSFLGFCTDGKNVDIAPVTVRKLMDKIRRQARSLRRWKLKNNISDEKALMVFNRKFNRKFYSNDTGRELCWSRWYFPLITTDKSLRAIDEYMQQYQRYLITGRHSKSNYSAVPYDALKKSGYLPLVSAYYNGRKNRNDI